MDAAGVVPLRRFRPSRCGTPNRRTANTHLEKTGGSSSGGLINNVFIKLQCVLKELYDFHMIHHDSIILSLYCRIICNQLFWQSV